MLDVEGVSFKYGSFPVLNELSLHVEKGEFVSILGANGCGKTTLLRLIMGFLRPQSGNVLLDGSAIHKMDEKALALKVAYIPQAHAPPFAYSVMDVVLMGRTPHMSFSYSPSAQDRKIAASSIEALELQRLTHKNYTELSGGQRQLVIIARALTQQPKLLIMDEPTSNLDYGNQYLVLSQVKKLADSGMGVLMVTHDPMHAAFCADRVVVMQKGTIIRSGHIDNVITEPVMSSIYSMDIRVRNVLLAESRDRVVCIPDP